MKRSQVVALLVAGSAMAGIYGVLEHRKCAPNDDGIRPPQCQASSSSSSSSRGFFSSGHWLGSSSSSGGATSASTPSASTHVAFGGFGNLGSVHASGAS